MKRPTIRDVARRAGVSHQTVSRVINGDSKVLAPTRKRVLAAIHDLDYVPNAIARSLSSNRTHTLGFVTANVVDYAFGQTVAGAEAEARRHGFYLVVGSVEDATDEADEEAYLRLLLQRRVEGLILDWPTLRTGGPVLSAAAARVPLVLVAAAAEVPGVEVVDVDNRRGGFDATSFLIGQGHRAIRTITGPLGWSAAQARLDGFRDALRAAGLPEAMEQTVPCPDWGPASGRAAMAQLLETGVRFTALFAQSDLLAIGALAELRDRGLRVPADVSVIGFDDIPIASFIAPPLTTMRQPMREVGALAAGLLIDAIAQRAEGEHEETGHLLLPAELVVRRSVAPGPAGQADGTVAGSPSPHSSVEPQLEGPPSVMRQVAAARRGRADRP